MEEFVVAAFIEQEDRNHAERERLRCLRDASNPFLLQEQKFRKLFRLSNLTAKYLCEQLDNHPDLNDVGFIPKHLVILGCLHFFADGSYQTPVGADNIISLSQPSMSRAIEKTTNAIIDVLTATYIKFPTTQDEKQATMRDFYTNYGMPGTLGAVDGTHMAIFKPSNADLNAPGIIFYNRKGYYSINCQVIANAKGLITSINPNFPGSTHDAAVWRASALHRHMEREYIQGHQEQWLLGDKGYPLLPWVMIPVSGPANQAEERYNASHARARNIVEMTFGRLKNKFRCLHKHRTLHYEPKKAARIIVAVSTIYNMFSDVLSDDESTSSTSSSDTSSSDDDSIHEDNENIQMDYLNTAREKRASLISRYFRR